MIRWRRRNQRLVYVLIDCITILISYQIAINFYQETAQLLFPLNMLEKTGQMIVLAICFIGMFLFSKLYDESILEDDFFSLRVQVKTVAAFVLAMGLCVSVMMLMDVPIQRLFLLYFVMSFYGFYILSKVLLLQTSDSELGDNKVDRRILLVGCTLNGRQYIDEINKAKQLGLKIVGYIDINADESYEDIPRLGDLPDMESIVRNLHIDEIAVARPLNCHPLLESLLDKCQDTGITISMLLSCHNTDNAKVQVAMVGSVPVLKFHTVSLNENQLLIKRTVDVFVSVVGMAFFGIALVVFAPLIIIETPGPVIEKQERVGRNGRILKIWQFRTMGVYAASRKSMMTVEESMNGQMPSAEGMLRLTRVGAFLQRAGIDRLPQIYNVLRGDLSLVGTRPSTVEEVERYEFRHRKHLSITPGITGIWRINNISETTDVEEIVRQDSDYITNWTVWSDFNILFASVLGIRRQKSQDAK